MENVRSTSVYLFAQDSWKIKRNVTLNYGLRWELNTPIADIGHHVQTFRPGQNSTIYPCQLNSESIASFQSVWDRESGLHQYGNNSNGPGRTGRCRRTQRLDADLLQGLRSRVWDCLESGRLGQDQHPRRLGAVLQPDRAACAGAVQCRTAVRRQHLPGRHFVQYSVSRTKAEPSLTRIHSTES